MDKAYGLGLGLGHFIIALLFATVNCQRSV